MSWIEIAAQAVSCGSGQKVKELAEFLELLSALNPQVIVEIGVASGGTTYAFQQVAPVVIGIEIRAVIVDSVVVIGNSHDVTTRELLLDVLGGQMIDCLFIDGDHTYEGVRQDYKMYRPCVREGGLIAFHDIACYGIDIVEVDRFWSEVCDDTAREIIDPEGGREWGNNWGGIGILVNHE